MFMSKGQVSCLLLMALEILKLTHLPILRKKYNLSCLLQKVNK